MQLIVTQKKPWWCPLLTDLWNARCQAETEMCSASLENKHEYRNIFLVAQRQFDKKVRFEKRQYWYREQQKLLTMLHGVDFWKKFGNIGIKKKSSVGIPWEVVENDGTVNHNKNDILNRWKSDFEQLLNQQIVPDMSDSAILLNISQCTADLTPLGLVITIDEVQGALNRSKNGKSMGDDGIPVEVLRNDWSIAYLVKLFNVCFHTGTVPDQWSRGIIIPIPKNAKNDLRDPMNYRGITVACATYKLYCSVLNNRLTKWVEHNDVLCDEQAGFRSGRCTTDHLGNVCYLVETRMKKRLQTFSTFVDFSKAYDRVNRSLLWEKLHSLGIRGPMLRALKSLYRSVRCSVRVNGIESEWFNVTTGLRQGCILSPLLFNLLSNDIIQEINSIKCGVKYNGTDELSILMYADDIMLISDSEVKLQQMLHRLNMWCARWCLTINTDKSKVMHFRPPSIERTVHAFKCGMSTLEIVSQYKYLGVILTEHLDYITMTKQVAQSASRALGLLIAKDKAFGGMPYECFSKCYDAIVQATIDYSASVWGTKSFSCINAVQFRACRYFLGVGKYTPTAAVSGDMGWTQPEHRQWLCVIRHWCRLLNLENNMLTKKVFVGCLEQAQLGCKTWLFRVTSFLRDIGFHNLTALDHGDTRPVLVLINCAIKELYDGKWHEKLVSDHAVRGREEGGNKLRTYRKFKKEYATEQYVSVINQKKYRSAYAKFRCGVAPIKIETCRYGLQRVPVEQRLCETCHVVEDEFHVVMECTLYDDIRKDCLNHISSLIPFFMLTIEEQFIQVMSNPKIYRSVSKAMYLILNRRHNVMTK